MLESTIVFVISKDKLSTHFPGTSPSLQYALSGELRLSGNHTMMEYEMRREPYSQKS